MLHMSSCGEFRWCSDVLCLLFRPLFLHWKKCCGPCAVCGPVNMKYNKKKLLEKLSSALDKSEILSKEAEEAVFDRHRETDLVWRQGMGRVAPPYNLRRYMTEEQLSVPEACSSSTTHIAGSQKVEESALSCAGNTWSQLPGIDMNHQRLFGKSDKPEDVKRTGFLESHVECNSWSCSECPETNATNNRSMQDLLDAISLYNSLTGV